ncbi:MAG: PadR family transcriptional regulator [Acidobacteriota bacterium]|jgi:DNA-binding PadR family transcriptional regulator
MSKSYLGEFEQLVLLAVLQRQGEAHAPAISRELEQSAGRKVSRGALYATLERLENKGLLRWKVGAATSERGGHRKRRFEVTDAGIEALREVRTTLEGLWSGLDEVFARDGQ